MQQPDLITGGSSDIRRMNQSAILQLVYGSQPIARTQIATVLGLNPSTVNRLVEQLMQEGLLLDSGASNTTDRGGRPARLIRFNADAARIAVLDLSDAPWRAALTDLNGEIVQTFTATPVLGVAQANLDILAVLLDEIMAANQDGPPIRGIGIGAPSIVLWRSGTVVWAASLGWRDLALAAWVEARWSVPVFVENDVNLLALGESWRGAGQNAQNLAVIALGTGIGAGLVLDGKLFRGANEAAGEVGYLPPNIAALGQTYTGFGPLEALAATPGLVQRAVAAVAAGESSSLAQIFQSSEQIKAGDVYAAARQGDPLAQSLVAESADYLALAIAGVAVVLNPEMILLGGELTRTADLFLDPIRRRLDGLLPVMPLLRPAQLTDQGVLMGAVALVLRNTEPSISATPVV